MKHEKNPNQKAFKIITKKQIVISKPAEEPLQEVDTAKAVAFAMSIAQEMKMRQRQADVEKKAEAQKRTSERSKQYSNQELKTFRSKLLEIREDLLSHSLAMKSSVGIEEADDVEPDGGDGTSQSMRLDTISHSDQSQRSLREIEEAMRKIADGSYGICVSCGQLISRERLLHSPFVKTCTTCQQEFERGK